MSLVCRGIRGATTARDNTREAILEATRELLERLVEANDLRQESVAAAIFTTTRDLNTAFPAVAARQMGWVDVALLCSHEMDVPNALPCCIRVLLLVNTDKEAHQIVNVYLRGAINLRAWGMEDG